MLREGGQYERPVELWNVPPHWVKMTPYLGNPGYLITSPSGLTMTVSVDDMFLGIDVLSGVRRGPVAVFRDAHDLSGHTEMLQHGVPHGKPALKKAHVLAVRIPQLFNPHIPAQGRHAVAFVYAPVLFFPIGCENVELLLCGARYYKHKRRGGAMPRTC